MDELMLKILELVVTIATMVIARYAVPYLKTLVGTAQLDRVKTYVQIAVEAVEQIVTKEKSGQEKKEMVVDYVTNVLISKGIIITAEDLDMLIESAVRTMKQMEK